jgi:hypothetical protein
VRVPARDARFGFARIGTRALFGADGRYVKSVGGMITTTSERDERGAYPKTSSGPEA